VTSPKGGPLSTSQEVLDYIRNHFCLDGELILRDGRPARASGPHRGYFSVSIGRFGLRRRHVAWRRGRLKWFLHTGELPDEIDHRDCDPGNDAINNLRAATRQLNNMNRRPFKKVNGLPLGVYLDRRNGRYRAHPTIGGKMVSMGQYATAAEASAVVQAALKADRGEYFRSRHKRPSRSNLSRIRR
jgi:hypothetical protein